MRCGSPRATKSWGLCLSVASSIIPSSCTFMPLCSTFLADVGMTFTCWRPMLRVNSMARPCRCIPRPSHQSPFANPALYFPP